MLVAKAQRAATHMHEVVHARAGYAQRGNMARLWPTADAGTRGTDGKRALLLRSQPLAAASQGCRRRCREPARAAPEHRERGLSRRGAHTCASSRRARRDCSAWHFCSLRRHAGGAAALAEGGAIALMEGGKRIWLRNYTYAKLRGGAARLDRNTSDH